MTHAEMFTGIPTPGFDKPTCTGELGRQWVRSDEVYHDARYVHHTVELYLCTACSTYISFDASVNRVLNAYQRPDVPQLAHEQARASSLPIDPRD